RICVPMRVPASDFQRLLQDLLRLLVISLPPVDSTEGGEVVGDSGVRRPEHILINLQGTLDQGDCVSILLLLRVEHRQSPQINAQLRVSRIALLGFVYRVDQDFLGVCEPAFALGLGQLPHDRVGPRRTTLRPDTTGKKKKQERERSAPNEEYAGRNTIAVRQDSCN